MKRKINNRISVIRKKLYKDISDYTLLKKKKNDNYLVRSDTYPCTWFINNGYYKLKSFFEPDFTRSFIQNLKEFILISKLSSYKLCSKENHLSPNIDTLYVSWCTPSDFNFKGKYKDKYIKTVNKKNSHWFLLNIGNNIKIKKNNKQNYSIFQKQNLQGFDLYFLIKVFFSILIKEKFNLFKIKPLLSVDTIFAYMVNRKLLNFINFKNIKTVILTYEAQPFQKLLIKNIRKKNKYIEIISYLTAVQPFPVHLFNGINIPNKNFSVSRSQILQLTKIFNWNKKKLTLIKSHRFNKNVNFFKNNILLPYIIVNQNKILNNLEKIFSKSKDNLFNKPKIIPHPIGILGKDYQKFVKKLEDLMREYDHKFEKKILKNNCLTVGSTSVIFDALEHGLKVYHIVNEPVLEALDNLFWPTVDIKNFNDNVFIYSTKYKKKLVNY